MNTKVFEIDDKLYCRNKIGITTEKLLMLHIYQSICRAYCLVVDNLPSVAIRYLWSMKDITYAGPKMLKK